MDSLHSCVVDGWYRHHVVRQTVKVQLTILAGFPKQNMKPLNIRLQFTHLASLKIISSLSPPNWSIVTMWHGACIVAPSLSSTWLHLTSSHCYKETSYTLQWISEINYFFLPHPTIRASLAPRHALFLAIFSQGQSGVRWHPVTHYFWSFGAECAARARGKRPTERQIKGDIRKITRSLKTIPLQTNSYIFKC